MNKFKHSLFVLAVLLGTVMVATVICVPSAYADMQDYYKGYNSGWSEGWRKIKGRNTVPPVPSVPPVPGAEQDNYQDGYNDGFLAGMAAANK